MHANLNVVTVLKSGGIYKPEHVERLKDQVVATTECRFWCMSDVDVPCDRVPLTHSFDGWWSKIELFRPRLFKGPIVYLDLDTDVHGNLNKVARGPFTMLQDFYKPHDYGSGVMAWTGDTQACIYHDFCLDPAKFMRSYRRGTHWGDQGFIRDHARGNIERFQQGLIASYKVHGLTDWATVTAYHGQPKPWDLPT